MIVELLLVASAVGATAELTRRWRARRAASASTSAGAGSPSRRAGPARAPLLAPLGFGFELGDVISVGSVEHWLRGGWLLEEEGIATALVVFSTDGALLALPRPTPALYVLGEVAASVPDDPPSTLEIEAARWSRVRRLPVSVRALGEAPDAPWSETLLGEYRSARGDTLWLLGRGAYTRAFVGRRVTDEEFERWGKAGE